MLTVKLLFFICLLLLAVVMFLSAIILFDDAYETVKKWVGIKPEKKEPIVIRCQCYSCARQ